MNILAIGAHYDDVELGCSGTLVKHVRAGDKVTILVVSDSAFKNREGEVVRAADVAEREGREAAAIIGADMVTLGFPTFGVPFDDTLGRQMMHLVEELAVDTIYCHWVHDVHRDHHYTARTALMAGRHVPRFLMYRSNFYDAEAPFRGNLYSDISAVMDVKIRSIRAHVSEMARVKDSWLEFVKYQNSNDGQRVGVKFAERFEVVRYLV